MKVKKEEEEEEEGDQHEMTRFGKDFSIFY
jgi:hypothetical protein